MTQSGHRLDRNPAVQQFPGRRAPKQDSERLGLPQGLSSRSTAWCSLGQHRPQRSCCFELQGRENMIADRAYSPGFFASTDRGASLLYFTAAVTAIGFVHGPGDVNPLNERSEERRVGKEW